jgi:hypothetical protein
MTLSVEPENWRVYSGVGGVLTRLKPDLFVVLASGEYEDHWFLEVDLSTESPAVVIRKCRQYIAYRNTGHEQHNFGVFPFVVWLVPDTKRQESLRRHINSELSGEANWFSVVTMDELESLILNGGQTI